MIDVLGLFYVICNHEIFIKLNLSILLVLGRQVENHKDASMFGFLLEFESFRYVKHPWCNEFSKVETFFGVTSRLDGLIEIFIT